MILLVHCDEQKKAEEKAGFNITEVLDYYPLYPPIQMISDNGTAYSCDELRQIYGDMITFCETMPEGEGRQERDETSISSVTNMIYKSGSVSKSKESVTQSNPSLGMVGGIASVPVDAAGRAVSEDCLKIISFKKMKLMRASSP